MADNNNLEISERTLERRKEIEERVQGYLDWLYTLRHKVINRIISEEEKDRIIARTMVSRDLLAERAGEKSKKDTKTGLPNDRAFFELFDNLVQGGRPFGLLIIDIDHFKEVNDTHGHPVGDRVLIEAALDLKSNLRQIRPNDDENDMVARYGGEEFAILLPGMASEKDLEKVAEKLRTSIASGPYTVRLENQTLEIPITVSLGGGIYRNGNKEDFFQKVDKKGLISAKEQGRNRTVIVN